MPRVVGPVNPALPIEVNIIGTSPHVFAYRLWWRDTADLTWTQIAEGSTGDQLPDHHQRPFTPGAQLFYWVGVGGDANSPYSAVITLGQSGRVLPNGTISLGGRTNSQGVALHQDWVNFV